MPDFTEKAERDVLKGIINMSNMKSIYFIIKTPELKLFDIPS